VKDGKTKDSTPMIQEPAERRNASGQYVYPHRLRDGGEAPEAVSLLLRVLNEQPDHSVTIAQIGFSTNLARLLKAPGGRDLVQRKVNLLSLMAGNFAENPKPEYNIYTDGHAAKELLASWPTPMVFSGFEMGLKVLFPYSSIEKDFSYVPNHPVAEAFKQFAKPGDNRPNYDSTAVLEAIRPDHGYFELSAPGRVTLGKKDVTEFTPDPQGNCRYLILKPENVSRVEEALVMLSSEPPQAGKPTTISRRVTF